MQSAWSDSGASEAVERYRAQGIVEDLALRVYTSRLIGQQSRLVLHGGGNTSVKTTLPDDLGRPTPVLCVKGSGWDLGSIEPQGFPAVRLETLAALRELDALSDEDMVNAARTRMLDASGPNPSVETLLHAFLPHKFIDHSHADAILSVVDQPDAENICASIYGKRFAVVPYIMPGFALAKLAAQTYERDPHVEGLVLLQHGLFTFGESARQSYERHIQAVSEAEAFIASRVGKATSRAAGSPSASWRDLAPRLRGRLGDGRRRYVLTLRTSDAIRAFADDPDLDTVSGQGPATPDHVIRTKRVPMILRPQSADLDQQIEGSLSKYRDEYRGYVGRQCEAKGASITPLDPDPRVIVVPGLGVVAAGTTAKAASIAADIYEHTVDVIRDATAVGRYQALTEDHIFDMEYWSLEQAKLGRRAPAPLGGQVVYVSGAASGIGAATARAFAAAGAHVFVVDRDAEALAAIAEELGGGHAVLDVTDRDAVIESIGQVVDRYGGLDGVVSNAGTAPQAPIADCSPEVLQGSLAINLLSHQWLAAAATDVLRRQGTGGFLLFNASKAAFNPGAGFGPYAIAKAGLVALMKQYAVEGGPDGIRANAINADRIRTGLMSPEEIARRAAARGLDPDAYFRSNLLDREVTAADVAEAFVGLAMAETTTGAVLPVDGGNIAAAPR